jgi:Protein of unknown function (DUF2723)
MRERWHWFTPKVQASVWVAALGTFYLLTGVGNRSETADGYWFAYDVEHRSLRELLSGGHVRHLLFLPLFRGIHDIVGSIGIHARAYDEIRTVSAVVAAATLPLMFLVLYRRLDVSRFAAYAGAGALAVSHGFWRYANEAKVYPLAIMFILLICWTGLDKRLSARSAVFAGAIAALGVLFVAEVASTLIAVSVALVLRRHIRHLIVYLATTGVIVVGVTLLLYLYVQPPDKGYVGYLMSAAKLEAGGSPSGFGAGNLVKGAIGFGQNVTAGNFLYANADVAKWLQAIFPGKSANLAYAGRQAGTIAWVLSTVLLVQLLIVATVTLVATLSRPVRRPNSVTVAVAVWFATLGLFLLVREAGEVESWIPLLVPFWMLVAAFLFDRADLARLRRLVVLTLVLLAAFNSIGGMWIMRNRATDYNFQKARWLIANVHAGDTVLLADDSKFFRYLRYYASAHVLDVQCLYQLSGETLQALYGGAVDRSVRVYATADFFRPPESLANRNPTGYQVVLWFGDSIRHNFRKVADDEFGGVYVHLRPVGPARGASRSLPSSNPQC